MPIISSFPTGSAPKNATSSTAGVAKLYGASGANTDGAMTQKSVTDAISNIAAIRETNKNQTQKFWRGTKEEYNALTAKADDTLYIVTDDNEGGGASTLDAAKDYADSKITYGTEDLVDGESALAAGSIYIVYE